VPQLLLDRKAPHTLPKSYAHFELADDLISQDTQFYSPCNTQRANVWQHLQGPGPTRGPNRPVACPLLSAGRCPPFLDLSAGICILHGIHISLSDLRASLTTQSSWSMAEQLRCA
jgi:hypothetical protein